MLYKYHEDLEDLGRQNLDGLHAVLLELREKEEQYFGGGLLAVEVVARADEV